MDMNKSFDEYQDWWNKTFKECEENGDVEGLLELMKLSKDIQNVLEEAVKPVNLKVIKNNTNDTVYIIPTEDKPLKLIIED